MDVTEAVEKRKSTRAFKKDPIDTNLIRQLLLTASRAPSGGNVQPWKVYLLNGATMEEFRSLMHDKMETGVRDPDDTPQYQVYPDKLVEPYRTARFEVGEQMYGLLGIPREDKAARLKWFANNYQFFGAPAGFFVFFDRMMGPPQWSDMGMFLQTFMLLAHEAGFATCAQECWSTYPATVAKFCNAPDNEMLFCGMAIGYEDTEHPVNQLRTRRLAEKEWLTLL